MRIHPFCPASYRRARLPWMFLLFIPGLAVDAWLIGRTLSSESFDAASILELMFLLGISTLLFKGGAVVWYLSLHRRRRQSAIAVGRHRVTWRKCISSGGEHDFLSSSSVDLRITQVDRMVRRRNGAILVSGRIRKFSFQNKTHRIQSLRERKRCLIPPYYEDMDILWHSLDRLMKSGDAPRKRRMEWQG